MDKYWIIGPPGSGKSTLSKEIMSKKHINWYELDSIFWKEKWEKRDSKEFSDRIKEILSKDGYILDGYYREVSDLIDKDCTIVLLKRPLLVLYFRVISRSLSCILKRKKICGENYESFKRFFSKEGMISYTGKQYKFFENEVLGNSFSKVVKIRNNKELLDFIKKL